MAVFAAILTLLVFIVREVAPLLKAADVTPRAVHALEHPGGRALAGGVDEHMQRFFTVHPDGTVHAIHTATGVVAESFNPVALDGASLTAARYESRARLLAVGTSDGAAHLLRIEFPFVFEGRTRVVSFRVAPAHRFQLDPEGRALELVASALGPAGPVVAGVTAGDHRLVVVTTQTQRALLGPARVTEYRHDLALGAGRPTALAVAPDGRTLVVGTDQGLLYQWDLRRPQAPELAAVFVATGPQAGQPAGDGARVAAQGAAEVGVLRYLIGGEGVVVGDARGGVAVWFNVLDEHVAAGRRMQQVHLLEPHEHAITHVAVSERNRTFVTVDEQGILKQHYSTSNETFYTMKVADGAVQDLIFSPRGDVQAVLTDADARFWNVRNPHPEINLRTLFGKVHYEGYSEPEYVWQSTGGSDDFEPKFSLTPLAYGTLKGTIYSLLFAIPLGVFGAIYTSQFMHPRLQGTIKPLVEIMAGLPSVVLGFLAGLWLAPLVAQHLPGMVIMLAVVPAFVLLAAWGLRALPTGVRSRIPKGAEGLLTLPVILLGGYVSLQLGPYLEAWALVGDFRLWLYEYHGVTYDVRNSIVIGIAMGFAVIPIIFSISEDALSSVPRDLASGSLALGVTPWQTVMGVVVPTALPGIVSSVMIGFGRAVGETMIVLMATGNTPVMNMNLFSGFRALSANIAVEMPEAPVGGTLYRVLFAAALLLFVTTFVLNTVGEMVRLYMRKRVTRL